MNWIELGDTVYNVSKICAFEKTEKFNSHTAEKTHQITFMFDDRTITLSFSSLVTREYAYKELLSITKNDNGKTIDELLEAINKTYQPVDIEEAIGFPCYRLNKKESKVDKYKEQIEVNADYICIDFGDTKENGQEPHFLSFDDIENIYNLMKNLKVYGSKKCLSNMKNI